MRRLHLALAGAAAAAVVAVLPVTTLLGPGWSTRLTLETGARDLGWLAWGRSAVSPDVLRETSIVAGVKGLAAVTTCVIVIGAALLIALGAVRAGRRGAELRVHRAVGASRRHLLLGESRIAGVLALAAIVVGGAAGTVVSARAAGAWPGSLEPVWLPPTLLALLAVAALVLVTVNLAVLPALRIRTEAGPAAPVPLAVPMALIALSAVALTTASSLERPMPVAQAALTADRMQRIVFPDGDALGTVPAGVGVASPGLVTGLGMVEQATTDCGQCFMGGFVVQWHVVRAVHHLANADSFPLLGIGLRAGQLFSGQETEPVAIVSRSLAGRHFEGGDAIGRHILIGHGTPRWHRVIGIVDDRPALVMGARDLPAMAVYLSPNQHAPGDADLLLPPGAAAVTLAAAEPPVPTTAAFTTAATALDWLAARYRLAGGLGLVLAIAGTVVVMVAWSRALASELGVRRAVGARSVHLTTYVLGRVLLAALGAIGVAFWLGPLIWQSVLPQLVNRVDGPVGTVPAITALLGLVGVFAVLPVLIVTTRAAPAHLLRDPWGTGTRRARS